MTPATTKNRREKRAYGLNSTQNISQKLVQWYRENKRSLPWRKQKKAYPIWISEVMLQQTTTQAVIPFYKRFLSRFPSLKSLAEAPVEDVIEHWAGLGYYSRARNLHKAAIHMHKNGFPRSYQDLLPLPGFGPYTARSVASLAFNESVGVIDGNVIRVLSRLMNDPLEWWKTEPRQQLQATADQLVVNQSSSEVNQALMELGATICTPQSPSCLLCPLRKNCLGLKHKTLDTLPLKKAKPPRETILWTPTVAVKKNQIAIVENNYAPFLKKAWILPGQIRRLKEKPKRFDYRHSITKYDIFIRLPETAGSSRTLAKGSSVRWVPLDDISQTIPYNLVKKALKHMNLLDK